MVNRCKLLSVLFWCCVFSWNGSDALEVVNQWSFLEYDVPAYDYETLKQIRYVQIIFKRRLL